MSRYMLLLYAAKAEPAEREAELPLSWSCTTTILSFDSLMSSAGGVWPAGARPGR